MYFTDGTLSSCIEMSLTSLKDIEICFQNKVVFSSFCTFASMSYNPDTGIKDLHCSLKL